MILYQVTSLAAAAAFTVVGLIFLIFPASVLHYFNGLSSPFALPPSPVQGGVFYLALAAAYMYLVALLAWRMYRQPEEKIYPQLLMQGKMASSLLSIGLFLTDGPYLIYLANFLIDGLIAAGVWGLIKMRKAGWRR